MRKPKTINSNPLTSIRSELLEWAINNQCTSFELLEEYLRKCTFGKLRYTDWQPATDDNTLDDERKHIKYFFLRSFFTRGSAMVRIKITASTRLAISLLLRFYLTGSDCGASLRMTHQTSWRIMPCCCDRPSNSLCMNDLLDLI